MNNKYEKNYKKLILQIANQHQHIKYQSQIHNKMIKINTYDKIKTYNVKNMKINLISLCSLSLDFLGKSSLNAIYIFTNFKIMSYLKL